MQTAPVDRITDRCKNITFAVIMVKWNDGANVIWLSLFSSEEVKVYSDGQVEVNSKVKHWQSLLRMYGFLMGPTNLWRV